MKRIIYGMLALSLFVLPACKSHTETNDNENMDTTIINDNNGVKYDDTNGGVPVSPDSTGAMNGAGAMNNTPGDNGNNGGSNTTNINRETNRGTDMARDAAKKKKDSMSFAMSGQYDSRKGRPAPVNLDDKRFRKQKPAHSVGDTAPNHTGIIGTR